MYLKHDHPIFFLNDKFYSYQFSEERHMNIIYFVLLFKYILIYYTTDFIITYNLCLLKYMSIMAIGVNLPTGKLWNRCADGYIFFHTD